jgi:transposase
MKKAELRKWLSDRGLSWEERWLRARLAEEVEKYRDNQPMIEKLAENNGHKVLFLPVRHSELNPIELVWATAKNYCASVFSNTTTFQEQRQHLEESFKKDVTPEYCAKLYKHVQLIEENYWEADLAMDDEVKIGQESSQEPCQ